MFKLCPSSSEIQLTNPTLFEGIQLNGTADYVDIDAPGPQQLTKICSRENLFFGMRSLGAGILSTGLTSIGCDYMMEESPTFKLSQGLLAGIGGGLYIAGSLDIVKYKPGNAPWHHWQQCLRDGVVPMLTAMSVYLARSHGII